MNKFHRASEAKEFVASRIVEQAQRDGAPLTELERKMLYVSAPEMSDTEEEMCSEFDRNFDQDIYERRVAALIRNADRRYRQTDKQAFLRWRSATQLLLRQDHYIGVMIARAKLRPPWDLLKLIGTAILVVCVAIGVAVLMDKWGIEPPTKAAAAFWLWIALLPLAVLYFLVRLMAGQDRLNRAWTWVWNRISKHTSGAG